MNSVKGKVAHSPLAWCCNHVVWLLQENLAQDQRQSQITDLQVWLQEWGRAEQFFRYFLWDQEITKCITKSVTIANCVTNNKVISSNNVWWHDILGQTVNCNWAIDLGLLISVKLQRRHAVLMTRERRRSCFCVLLSSEWFIYWRLVFIWRESDLWMEYKYV